MIWTRVLRTIILATVVALLTAIVDRTLLSPSPVVLLAGVALAQDNKPSRIAAPSAVERDNAPAAPGLVGAPAAAPTTGPAAGAPKDSTPAAVAGPYKVVDTSHMNCGQVQNSLNAMTSDGWEFHSATLGYLIFKKR